MRIKTPVKITNHARESMQQRRISKDDVFDAILNPEIIYTDKNDYCVVKGKLCVVIVENTNGSIVKTVLLTKGERWTNEDVRKRSEMCESVVRCNGH